MVALQRRAGAQAVRKVDLEASQGQSGQAGGKPRRNPMEDLKREIMIMKKMKHTNIVMLSEVRSRRSRPQGVSAPGSSAGCQPGAREQPGC
jgi:hypothetical protein